jgi:hypothetical protein
MMTDHETLEAMLTRAGVIFSSEYGGDKNFTTLIVDAEGHTQSKNQGYIGFYTEFVFDLSGQLVAMGAWE